MNNRLIKSNDAGGGGACTNTVDLYNPFPDGGGVALYQLNGDATDVSGNYDGTWSGTEAYTTGVFGQAGVFNGSNSQILVSSVSGFPSGNSARTLSFWMNSSSYLDGGVLGYGAAANNEGFLFYVAGGNLIVTFYLNDASVNYSLSTNQWYNIVATHDGSTFTVYVNGSSVYSAAKTLNTSATNFKIGGAPWNSGAEYFQGSIDQVRIFNRVLRPYEVEALYTEEYCTPTIVPSEHFNTVTYTAATTNGTYDITGSSFQPDLIWVKNRDNVEQHYLMDSVRGLTNMTDKFLQSSTTNSESSASPMVNGTAVTAIDGGFRVVETSITSGELYFNGRDYVSWNFKAGGAAVTNTDGTITSQVSANTEAGFSVVKQVPNNTNQTYGHGLGVAPSVIISKNLNVAGAWGVYHKDLGTGKYLFLNTTAAVNPTVNANVYPVVNDTVFSGGSGGWNSTTGGENAYINYCFAEVEGFSNFGSYVATSDVATNVITGFEPAFVMIKAASDLTSGFEDYRSWVIYDNKRNITDNQTTDPLYANRSYQEGLRGNGTAGAGVLDFNFNSNGFSINVGSVEARGFTGEKFIYMAFAADPTAVEPTLEDSFNTVLYQGDGTSSQPITGVGFQPDFTWVKNRSSNDQNHAFFDSVRGVQRELRSDATAAENNYSATNYSLKSFDNNGFTVGDITAGNYNVNGAVGGTYSGAAQFVAWCWKGAEIPAINSNGSIPSVVSANPAAGFSIVSYTGNNIAGATIGHGLGVEPDVIIVKNRDTTDIWTVQHSALGYTNYIDLSSTNATTVNSVVWYAQPTNEVFSFGANPRGNGSGNKIIAYCFAEVAGFSKFGSYTGTGNTSGNIITTGFEPAFIMIKCSTTSTNWVIYDNKRDTANPRDHILIPNTSGAEVVGYPGTDFDFNSTSFQAKGNDAGINASGQTYIYMAFANQF